MSKKPSVQEMIGEQHNVQSDPIKNGANLHTEQNSNEKERIHSHRTKNPATKENPHHSKQSN